MKAKLTLLAVLIILMASCVIGPCVLGDACEAGVMAPVHATETSAAHELFVQLTAIAK